MLFLIPQAPVTSFRLPNTCTVWLAPLIPHALPTECHCCRNQSCLLVAAGPWRGHTEQEAGLLLLRKALEILEPSAAHHFLLAEGYHFSQGFAHSPSNL